MKSHRLPAKPALNDLVQTDESAAADEKNLLGVHLDVFLVRMFATALRRHIADGAFENLQERLLHAFSGDVACDADVLRLAADLVDLVDVNDAHLGALDIVVGILKEPQNDVFDILAHIARFGHRRRIGDAERNIQNARQRSRQERLARAGRSDQQDVALFDFDLGERTELVDRCVEGRAVLQDALVMIVDRDREDLLGLLLPDDMLIELAHDFGGLGHADARSFVCALRR